MSPLNIKSALSLLREEALHPGSIDKIILAQQIQDLLLHTTPVGPELRPLIAWYTGTLERWRRSLRSARPLADIHPADRPRIRQLLLTP